MIANPLLSIVIPTFNRAELLDYCLGIHIPLARVNNIQIFIFDNSSPDATETVVKKRIEEYPLIHYYHHETNLGPDKNFEFALKYPTTDYIWLLGDSYQMPTNGIDYLLNLISINSKMYDMFLFNIGSKVKDTPARDYQNQNLLLGDLFWLMNCMSCLVFSKKLIADANFERYRNTYFIQTGIIFEYISNREFIIHWEPKMSIILWEPSNAVKKVGWQSNVFEIWFKNRTNLIFSLPASYDLDIKLKLAMETHIHSKVSISNLLSYRADGMLDYGSYLKYKYLFPVTVKFSPLKIAFISIIPKSIPILLKSIKKIIDLNFVTKK